MGTPECGAPSGTTGTKPEPTFSGLNEEKQSHSCVIPCVNNHWGFAHPFPKGMFVFSTQEGSISQVLQRGNTETGTEVRLKCPNPLSLCCPQDPAHPLGKLSLDICQVLHKAPWKPLPVCVTQLEDKTGHEGLTGNIRGLVTTTPCGDFWKQRENTGKGQREQCYLEKTQKVFKMGTMTLPGYKLC